MLQASEMALTLFEEGQREAASRGLLLVDTKYEFGLSPQGEVLLIDEIHTPDSSRLAPHQLSEIACDCVYRTRDWCIFFGTACNLPPQGQGCRTLLGGGLK